MPEVFRYARDRVKSLRTNQMVRLETTVTPVTVQYEVFNLTSRFGDYGRVLRRNDRIQFSYSPWGRPPYEYSRLVTNTSQTTDARFCWSKRHRLHLIYHRATDVFERRSDDDGRTWTGEVLLLDSYARPDISCDEDGTLFRAARETTGTLRGLRQSAGAASIGEANFILKDDAGSNLITADDDFRIITTCLREWWLHVCMDGESDSSLWFSTDAGETWTRTTGAVAGITNGTHPGLCLSPTGDLLAWAYTGSGTVQTTHRAAGESAWSTPVTLQDDASSDFLVRDNAFSLAGEWGGTNRYLLAGVRSTHTQPSDWHSSDEGATVEQFPIPET
jgi:hypothetical protein